jgi:penicillin-binding protein 1A
MSHRQRQARRRRGRGRPRNVLLLTFAMVAAVVAIGVLAVIGYIAAVAATAPSIDELKPQDKGASSVIYAADGSRLGYVQSDVVRTPVTGEKIPQDVRDATVAIEDEHFYKHKGVDYGAIIRAGIRNLQSGKTVQGGSTITQQLVRSLYIRDPKRNFQRKIREAKLASELEQEHPGRAGKDWILTQYLNSVPYGTIDGRTAVGVEAASITFFAEHARRLTLDEAALLAGLPQAPSEYNPFRNPTAARTRRNEVLEAMAANGYITAAEAADAESRPLGLKRSRRYTRRREPYFFDYVEEELIQRYGVGVYRRGGLKVYTTINPKLQEAGRQAIQGQLPYADDPSSAIVSIDPRTGYIRAMASSGSYRNRTFNLAAQGHRQPGSAFKTMVLTTAIREGVDPQRTTYESKPLALNIPGYGPWKVKTYGDSYAGRINVVKATLLSDNTVYAQLDVDLGPKRVKETAKLMGITTKLDALPSEGLGGLRLGVSPLEMARAYATLAAGGMRPVPKAIKRVEFPDGKSDDVGKPERKRVFPDGVAYEVTRILEQNVQQGTATRANFGCPAGAKTGTTDNFNDAWLVGYTPTSSTAVWVGYPNALREMRSVHGINVAGGTFPAQIWHDFMAATHGSNCQQFPPPKQRVVFRPFFGRYSKTGTRRDFNYSYDVPPGVGDNSAGGEDYRGYDPRLYESPPQGAPRVRPPRAPRVPRVRNGSGGAPPNPPN